MGAFLRVHPAYFYSILLHGVVIVVVFFFASDDSAVERSVSRQVVIELDPGLAREVRTRQQVVQTEKGADSKEPADDAFLGERTQTVEQEVVSSPKTGTASSSSQAQAPERSLIQGTGALAKYGISISANSMESPKPKARDVVAEAAMDAQVRGEYVKGFKEGEATLLNTREYVFYGYFQRIRENLDRAWERSLREQLTKYFHRGRQLASEQDYMTQILVSLDSSGQITRVQVIGASGTQDLDEAAVKAFNDAGPFPNPPRGLMDESGQVFVRWDFVLRT